MKMKSDTRQFWQAIDEAESLLAGDATGLARFGLLLEDLSSDLFEVRLVAASGADDIKGTAVLLPSPYLKALLAALRAYAHDGLPDNFARANADARNVGRAA